jgi:hypothetical protein
VSAPGFRRPPCGNNLTAHRPHRFPRWSSDTDQSGQCDGWTPMEAGVTEMATAVLDAIHIRAANPRGWFCPMCGREDDQALQLEVSPAAAASLRQCIDLPYSTGPAVLDSMYGMPVVLTADLPRGGWRITEPRPAIASGTVTMDSTPRGPTPDLVIYDDPTRGGDEPSETEAGAWLDRFADANMATGNEFGGPLHLTPSGTPPDPMTGVGKEIAVQFWLELPGGRRITTTRPLAYKDEHGNPAPRGTAYRPLPEDT